MLRNMKNYFRDSKHHRVPRSKGGTNDPRNISLVQENMHIAYHTLFKNKSPEEIAFVLNKYWIDPDKLFIVIDNKFNCRVR